MASRTERSRGVSSSSGSTLRIDVAAFGFGPFCARLAGSEFHDDSMRQCQKCVSDLYSLRCLRFAIIRCHHRPCKEVLTMSGTSNNPWPDLAMFDLRPTIDALHLWSQ